MTDRVRVVANYNIANPSLKKGKEAVISKVDFDRLSKIKLRHMVKPMVSEIKVKESKK